MPAFDTGSHMDLVDVTVTLADAIVPGASFSSILLICDDLAGGARVTTYTSLAAVVADTSNLSATAVAMATKIFSQREKPPRIKIGNRDVSGSSETYVEALDAIMAVDSDFYAIVIESRTASDAVALAGNLETKATAQTAYYVLFAQSADADWLTSGIPSAFSSAAAYTRLVVCYHATATQYYDAGLVGSGMSWDADTTAVGFNRPVAGVTKSGALTAAQKGFARANNANTLLPFGTGTDLWSDPGNCIDGTAIDNLLAVDWLLFRLKERTADLMVDISNRGSKLTVDARGQALIQGRVIDRTLEQGITAGHFAEGQYIVTAEAITATDISNRELRFTVYNTVTRSVRSVDIDVTSSTAAVVTGS